MKLLFIRHAETFANQAGRMQGQAELADPAQGQLSPQGRQQAMRLAQRLRTEWQPTWLYYSPAVRSRQTANILQQALTVSPATSPITPPTTSSATVSDVNSQPKSDLKYQPESEPISDTTTVKMATELCCTSLLHEIDLGIFNGLTWAEAQQHDPDLCHRLETSQDWIAIPNAETPTQSRDRAQAFIQHILSQHQTSDQLWIVTHSGILQHLVSALLGCDRTWSFAADYTGLFEFWLDCDRWSNPQQVWNSALWQIRRFNDVQHL